MSSVRMITFLPAISCSACLYALNCSSSVGKSVFPRYRNSLRNRPIPSASLSSTLAMSDTLPIFAYRCTCLPSFVTVSCPFICCSSCCFSASSAMRAFVCSHTSLEGSTTKVPANPSTTACIPFCRASSSTGTPIRAGMFIIRARIAV